MARSRASDSKTAPDAGAEVDALPFEAALERLEAVVDRLEQGELELEASLAAFEEGVKLSKRCATQLDDAEQRVELLMKQGGKWLARPFAADDDGDDEPFEDED